MIHRADAQMNSYPFDCRTSAEDSSENMYRSLFVSTRLMWVAGCRAFEETDMMTWWYELQVQPLNHNRNISWPKSPWTSPSRDPWWGPRFPMIIRQFDSWQLEQQKRCGCYSCEWTFDSFRFCILRRRQTNSGACESLSMSDRSWCDTIKSGFTYFLTHTSYHATFVCDVNKRCVRKHSNAQD